MREERFLQPGEFRRLYGEVPVLLRGAALFPRGWGPGSSREEARWGQEPFLARYGDLEVSSGDIHPTARHRGSPFETSNTVRGLLQPEAPPHNWLLRPKHPIAIDVRRRLRTLPLFERIRGQGPQVSVGTWRQGVTFHAHEVSWNVQLAGRKLWMVVPAGTAKPPYAGSVDPCDYQREEGLLVPQERRVQMCEVRAGEVLYLPGNWQHATCNLNLWNLAAFHIVDVGNWPLPHLHTLAEEPDRLEAATLELVDDRPEKALPVHRAAALGYRPVVERILLLRKSDMLERKDANGARPLYHAAMQGHIDVTELLLAEGADPEVWDSGPTGLGPLHVAALYGHPEVLKLVLKALLAHNDDGRRSDRGLSGVGRELADSKSKSGLRAFDLACHRAHLPVVQALLEAKSDPLATTTGGQTALHLAAGADWVAGVEMLLSLGAEANVATRKGRRPLHMAKEVQVVDVLLRAGAEARAVDSTGEMAAHKCADEGQVRSLKALHAAGSPLHQIDRLGCAPLHRAAAGGHLHVVQYLLDQAGMDLCGAASCLPPRAKMDGTVPGAAPQTIAEEARRFTVAFELRRRCQGST